MNAAIVGRAGHKRQPRNFGVNPAVRVRRYRRILAAGKPRDFGVNPAAWKHCYRRILAAGKPRDFGVNPAAWEHRGRRILAAGKPRDFGVNPAARIRRFRRVLAAGKPRDFGVNPAVRIRRFRRALASRKPCAGISETYTLFCAMALFNAEVHNDATPHDRSNGRTKMRTTPFIINFRLLSHTTALFNVEAESQGSFRKNHSCQH